MQSGGSGGGPARNPGMGPAGRTNSTSSAASPTSSSSSVQQQQQQQLASRQQVKSYEIELEVAKCVGELWIVFVWRINLIFVVANFCLLIFAAAAAGEKLRGK